MAYVFSVSANNVNTGSFVILEQVYVYLIVMKVFYCFCLVDDAPAARLWRIELKIVQLPLSLSLSLCLSRVVIIYLAECADGRWTETNFKA